MAPDGDGLRQRAATTLAAVRERTAPWVARAEPVLGPIRRALEPITRLGWTIAVVGVAAWWLGRRLGWDELLILAAACLVLLVIALASTLGRLGLRLDAAVIPERVVVGGEAVGQVTATNERSRHRFGGRVEVPVGANIHGFDVPGLGSGDEHVEPFIVPTSRRAIIPIGPAASVKGDPLGIARREVVSGGTTVLYVHPYTVRLPSFTAGWMRDLEGRTTNDLSTSDVAFHTLREYVPGDDRRHIHWKTTARIGQMMVRQFVDTRRSHLALLLSTTSGDWGSDDEFELGVSVVGSLGRTTLMDDQEVTMLDGHHPLPAHTPGILLDGLSGVNLGPGPSVQVLAQRAQHLVRGASIVALVVGSTVDARELRAACEWLGHDLTVLAIRCRPGADATRRQIGNVSIIELGDVDDLARVLAVVGAG